MAAEIAASVTDTGNMSISEIQLYTQHDMSTPHSN